ncbi:MAG: metallophosphoesterase family protein [Bacteroidales bacterium]
MKRIGLISDTHGFVHPEIPRIFASCDEIWHAGDFGSLEVAEKLNSIKPLRGVYGNIDGYETRRVYPRFLRFKCEDLDVLMTHIGGYPEHYSPDVKPIIESSPPDLFISGHSHILKVMPDNRNRLLHINPGAAGRSGIHQVITMVRFNIEGKKIKDLEVLEFQRS